MKKTEKNSDLFPPIYRCVYSRPRLVKALYVTDKVSVALVVMLYAALLLYSGVSSVWLSLEILALTTVPFVAVSLFRRFFDAPRPCELYDFASEGIDTSGRKKGSSFPSRHVFSAFLIGSLYFFFFPFPGAAILVFGAILAVCRVLLGIHFIRDVVAGSALGAILGTVGGLIIVLI